MNDAHTSNAHTKTSGTGASRLRSTLVVLADDWIKYSTAFAGALAAMLLAVVAGVSSWQFAAAFLVLFAGAGLYHARLQLDVRTARYTAKTLEARLLNEASASRILAGVKLLNGNDSQNRDTRLAQTARMATDYPAAVVFNLREAHGALTASSWSYDGQLNHLGDVFETIDDRTPGVMASRNGSAVVMSSTETGFSVLPDWAEQAGFTQGIVTPITRGLDTVGVVYVFNKMSVPPTLSEIEQLELIVSFASTGSQKSELSMHDPSHSPVQPFRVIDNSPERPTSKTSNLSMPGFALNRETERMEVNGATFTLSPTEFLLVHTLASSPGEPVSSDDLVDRCWDPDSRPADNAVDVAIFRLRKKLSKTGSGKGLIKTVRGSGYMFVPPSIETGSAVVAD